MKLARYKPREDGRIALPPLPFGFAALISESFNAGGETVARYFAARLGEDARRADALARKLRP